MTIEALKEAKSVIGSINSGKANALTIGGETVYWQRKEWVRWALDEVLPLIEQAIAETEKQEPVAMQMDVIVVNLVREGINKHRARELAEHFIKHTHPQPKREWVGLTDEEVIKCTPTWGGTVEDVARAIEAKLKEKNT
jgi:hypothetical protein